jgi:hypothetical protein
MITIECGKLKCSTDVLDVKGSSLGIHGFLKVDLVYGATRFNCEPLDASKFEGSALSLESIKGLVKESPQVG